MLLQASAPRVPTIAATDFQSSALPTLYRSIPLCSRASSPSDHVPVFSAARTSSTPGPPKWSGQLGLQQFPRPVRQVGHRIVTPGMWWKIGAPIICLLSASTCWMMLSSVAAATTSAGISTTGAGAW